MLWHRIFKVFLFFFTFFSRLEFLWHNELKRRGREGASLSRVFWRFCQTRMLVAIFSLLITMVAGFVGPVSTVGIPNDSLDLFETQSYFGGGVNKLPEC